MSVIPLSRAGLQLLAGPQHTCTEAWETNRVAKGAEPRVLLILHHTASSSTLNETTDFCYLSKDILKCDGHYFYCGCLVRKDIRVGQAGGCYFWFAVIPAASLTIASCTSVRCKYRGSEKMHTVLWYYNESSLHLADPTKGAQDPQGSVKQTLRSTSPKEKVCGTLSTWEVACMHLTWKQCCWSQASRSAGLPLKAAKCKTGRVGRSCGWTGTGMAQGSAKTRSSLWSASF